MDPASSEGAGAVVRVADPVLSVGEHLRLMGLLVHGLVAAGIVGIVWE